MRNVSSQGCRNRPRRPRSRRPRSSSRAARSALVRVYTRESNQPRVPAAGLGDTVVGGLEMVGGRLERADDGLGDVRRVEARQQLRLGLRVA